MNKFKVLVSRICYQHQWFEVEAPHEGYVDTAAIELAAGFDWGDNPTVGVEFEPSDIRRVYESIEKPERKVIAIFGEMEFDDDTCIIICEEARLNLPISKADFIARDLIKSGAYENFVIPELYSGTVL